ncbi:acetyl-CoA carboxylase biotin carboxyl carrier protein subunit [Oricola sp.]|uniref:acetyl-CoA carboxylase biotin carboxyl carrier protein subunit n=1 Tax=Oricola sp. TaxID=1979950 RepID=UPI0025FA8E49|nr:acetyl-CoA carboxylase biotin carboxyl carrier protein subunit [Oricola sp.]MCI5075484.1 acetyl-CoA carboxylase biotin carboxyl carrier protein subunit [Oricola sp.]
MSKTKDIRSSLTGTVWKIDASVGDSVSEDDPVVTLESMKMEIPVGAPLDGVITEILVTENDLVEEGQVIARMSV